MDTVFYIKNYKTEISTNSKLNPTQEHLPTEFVKSSNLEQNFFL